MTEILTQISLSFWDCLIYGDGTDNYYELENRDFLSKNILIGTSCVKYFLSESKNTVNIR